MDEARILLSIGTAAIAACGSTSHDAEIDAPPVVDATVLATTAVPLTGCGYSYNGEIAIGGSPFRLTIDTGSATLGVAGSSCPTCTAAGVAPLYTPGPTAVDLQQTAKAVFGDGQTWMGEIYRDSIGFGSLPEVPVAIVDITSQTGFFNPGPWCGASQGILGMSPVASLLPGTTSFPTELAAAAAHDVFALHYCLATGELWLDGYDPAAASAEPSYVAMTGPNFYTVELDDVAVDGTSVGVPAATYGPAIVDSGGPALGLPAAAYNAAITKIGASPAFQSVFGGASWFGANNCMMLAMTRAQLDASLPKVTVQIGSPPLSVELPATSAYLESYPTANGTAYCPGIFSSNFTDLGNTMIRAGLVIFDREQHRLGFAPTPACDDSAARPTARIPDAAHRRRR